MINITSKYISSCIFNQYNKTFSSKNFLITLTILPLLVEVVMLMVNGSLGTSVAVLGAFSLIRFRSIEGNSKEISSIFFAMAVGLALGMGHILFAAVITAIVILLDIVLSKTPVFNLSAQPQTLEVTVPEDLDYTHAFDDVFKKYTTSAELTKVKTTNLGSMFQLTYEIALKDEKLEKEFIDDLRCRNGNLDIVCSKVAGNTEL